MSVRPRRAALLRSERLEDRLAPAGDLLRSFANPGPALADRFGTSVSVDGNYVAVGAPFDDPGGVTDAGSVYVFNRTTGALLSTIPNPSPGVGDQFGFAVTVNESQGYVWVGAPYDDPGGLTDCGTAYAFFFAGFPYVTVSNPSPAAGDEFGYALANDHGPTLVAVGAPGDDFGATDAGRAYLYQFSGFLFNGTSGGVASNPTPAVGDRFGSAVSISPLYDLIVGAPFDDPGGVTDAGAVHVFNPDATVVVFTVANPFPAVGDRFGAALEVGSSTYRTVVGAPGDDPGGVTDAGSAYVIDMLYGGPTPGAVVQTLTNPSPAVGDGFGSAVSYRGSVAVVGAPGADPGGLTDAGAAYAFRALTGALLATLADPTPLAGDKFGAAVAQTADATLVGAEFADATAADEGAAHLYALNSPPTVRNDAAVVARNATAAAVVALGNDTPLPDVGETLAITAVTQGTSGGTVALSGGTVVNYTPPPNFSGTDTFTYTVSDGNGLTSVGTVTVTVGPARPTAPAATVPGTNGAGYAVAVHGNRAVVGSLNGARLIDTTTGAAVVALTPPAGPVSAFGSAVAISADLVVVGDYGAGVAGGSGAVHLYTPAGTFLRTLVAPTPPASQFFGWSVAVSGTTVAVGTWEDSGTSTNGPGRVHLFDGATGNLLRTVNNPTPAAPTEEGFGYAVALSGDTLVVGAYAEGASGTGQAYVFDAATGALVHTLTSPAGLTNAGFGAAVAAGGGWVVVGAREAAYVYSAATGVRASVLGDPTFTTTDSFGAAVAVAGNRVVVGALLDDSAGTNAGAAYLFDAPTGTYLGPLTNPSPTANDNFGSAVAVAGTRVVVGAYQDDPGGVTNAGSVYVFDINYPPTVVNDPLTVAEDAAATVVDVLANDTAAPDTTETLTVTAVTQPAAGTGTVTLVSGVVRYTPPANYFGSTSFTYTVSDGNGGSAVGTVNVTVTPVNDNPTAVNDPLTVAEDAAATVVDVLANDTAAPDTGETLTVAAVTQPAAGTGTVTLTSGVVRYTPPANYNGTTSFTYTVSDGNGGTATATVSVTVTAVNDPPTAVNDPLTVAEDSGATVVGVLANDTFAPDTGETLTVTAVTQPAAGTGAVTLVGGVVRYTPAANFNGGTSFTYTVSDGNGGTAVGTVSVTVTAVNDPPAANTDSLTVSEDAAATVVDVLANDSFAPDTGETLTVTAVTQPANGTVTLTGGVVRFTPAANFNGGTSFTYTLSDGNGGTATGTVNVTVTPVNDPPTANTDSPTVAEDSGATAVAVLANDTVAPDTGETLTVTAVTQPANGTVTLTGGVVRFTPATNFNGATSFMYTLSDGNGGTATGTVNVTVTPVNDPPTADTDFLTVAEDAAATVVDVLVNDTIAPDTGETLTVTAVTQPAAGTVTVTLTGGVVRFTPAANYFGATSFTYTVSDGNGGTATGTVNLTVTPVNDPPTANADLLAVPEDAPATVVAVLANDTVAPDTGETLTVTAVTQPAAGTGTVTLVGGVVRYAPPTNYSGATSFTYSVSDGNGGTATGAVSVTVGAVNDPPTANTDSLTVAEDSAATVVDVLTNDSFAPDAGETLTVTAVTQPANGTVTLTGGVVRFTPATNFNGATSFTYTLSDGNGGTATGTVNVTVTPVNDPPTAVNDSLTVPEDAAATVVGVLANDTFAPDAGETLTVASVTQPAHGVVTLVGGVVRYAPAAEYGGTDSFTYTVSDGNGGTAVGTVSVTVTPVNDPPTAAADALTVAEDAPDTVVDVLVNDSSAPEVETLVVTLVTPPAHGTVTLTGGVVRYAPAANYNGADGFTYTVSDGSGGTATGTVTVTVTAVNDPPSAAADAHAVAEDSPAVVVDVLGNDTPAPDGGETLTVTAVGPAGHGAVTLVGGVVSYAPAADYNGADSFTYTLSDGNGGTATGTVTVTVTPVNDPPTAATDTLTMAEDGGTGEVDVLSNDSSAPDTGETLTVTAVTPAALGNVTLVGAVVRYTPGVNFFGSDSFTYTLSDGNGGTTTGTVYVTVTPVDDPPTAAADGYGVGPGTTTLPVLANDTTAPDAGETLTVVAVTPPAGGTAAVAPGGAGVVFTSAAGFVGTTTFTYTVSDGTGTATASVAVTVLAPTPAVKPVAVGGAPDGSVRLVAADGGTTVMAPFGATGTPTRTATGDVDGDGVADVVAVTGPGTPLRVAVLSGKDGSVLVAPFDPFGGDFLGGGYVAAGDLDRDGRDEFVVSPDEGGGPRVTVFSRNPDRTTAVRANFFGIDDPNFRGGARAAVGDVNGDGVPDVVVAAGFGGGPRTAIFTGQSVLAGAPARLVNDFFAFPGADATNLRNGSFVAAGDVTGDGYADLVFGGGPGGAPRVFILSGARVSAGDVAGAQAAPVANFFVAGDLADRSGARVAVTNADGDARADVAVGSGAGRPARVRLYLGKDFAGGEPPATDLDVLGGAVLADGVYVG